MNKLRLTAFQKVIARTADIIRLTKIEKKFNRIEDKDGEIVAFKNGQVFLNDGGWYERQYAPISDIFKIEENRNHWIVFLTDNLGENCPEIHEFRRWINNNDVQPKSVNYTNITQSGIPALAEIRIDDDPPAPQSNKFEGIKVYVLPIDEVNIFIAEDTTGRFDKELSAENIEKLTYADCRQILGRYTDKNITDRIADCYSLEEFENEINFSVENTFNNNYYIKFVHKS